MVYPFLRSVNQFATQTSFCQYPGLQTLRINLEQNLPLCFVNNILNLGKPVRSKNGHDQPVEPR
jgi:hypothetical protein